MRLPEYLAATGSGNVDCEQLYMYSFSTVSSARADHDCFGSYYVVCVDYQALRGTYALAKKINGNNIYIRPQRKPAQVSHHTAAAGCLLNHGRHVCTPRILQASRRVLTVADGVLVGPTRHAMLCLALIR